MNKSAQAATCSKQVWQNANGTWSHYLDRHGEFADETAARTDLGFCREWRSL